jgi:tetratricopeptide (TPR) repeat protein
MSEMQNESKKDILKTVTRYAQAGEWAKVIKEYTKLLEMDPDDISLHNSMGDALSKVEEDRKAFEHYLKVLDDYQKKGNITKIPFMYKKISKLNPRKFDLEGKALHDKLSKIVEAQDFFSKGDYTRAIPALKEAHKLDKNNVEVLMQLGEACEKQLLIGDSSEAYVKALRLYSTAGKTAEAIEVAKRVISIDKTNVDAAAMLAEEMIRNGKKDQAAEMFKDVLISVAENNDIPLGRDIAKRAMDLQIEYGKQFYAYFLFKENKVEEARKLLESEYALTQEEKVLLGKIYYKTGEFEKAKSVLLSMDPEVINQNVEILEQIGDVLLKLSEHKKSAEYYFKAFSLLKSEDRLDAAIGMAHKVLNVDTENVGLHEALAEIYTKKNMKTQMIDEYMKLGKIYDKQGRVEESMKVKQVLAKLKML